MTRNDVISSLLNFEKPVASLAKELSELSWDYEGEPVILYSCQVLHVIEKFLMNDISEEELSEWANLIEVREDIVFENKNSEAMENFIHVAANPELEGPISRDFLKNLSKTLNS